MGKKYALVKLSDDIEECEVIGFATKENAIKELKQVLLKMVGPSDFEFCENIKEATTYEKLEKLCQNFCWGENNVRMLFIEEIK